MHVAGGMALGEIELGEVVVVGLDVGSFGDGKTHVGENRGQLVHHLADGMDASDLRRRLGHRQCHVQRLGVEALIERQLFQRVSACGNRSGDAIFETVDTRPLLLARFGGHRAERLQERGYRAVAAQRRNPHGFERRFIRRVCDGGQEFGLERAQVVHGCPQLRQRSVLGSSGLTKGRPSPCAAIHSSLTRIHQRACVSASLMSISRGLCTRPSRCLTTTWRS